MFTLKIRLSIMMFLQFFVLGTIIPIISLYFRQNLNFTGIQIGMILSAAAFAALISPLVGSFIADRLISSERLLGLIHFLSSGLILLLFTQKDFWPVFFIYLVYSLLISPTTALTSSITFHHNPEQRKNFGGVRVWGSIGWIAAGWVFGFVWVRLFGGNDQSHLPEILLLSALASLILGFYSFTLPQSPGMKGKSAGLIHFEALKIIKLPQIWLLSIFGFIVSFIDRFYYFGAAPFLRQIGYPESAIMPFMSIGQLPEIFGMWLLALLLSRFGFKKVLLAGVMLEIIRFGALAIGTPPALLIAGISFHGLAFTFFFIATSIYLDSHCNTSVRTGVHQLFSIITSGFGSVLGNFASGKAADMLSNPANQKIDFLNFWGIPFALSILVFILIGILFNDKKEHLDIPGEPETKAV